jgi:hypothetical protein
MVVTLVVGTFTLAHPVINKDLCSLAGLCLQPRAHSPHLEIENLGWVLLKAPFHHQESVVHFSPHLKTT